MIEQQTAHEAKAEKGDGSIINRLSEQLEAGANIKAVFGEPIIRNGVTVVPVARARWAVGGSSGKGAEVASSGTGAGAAVTITPVGFIEITEGGTCFKTIRSPSVMLAGVIGAAVVSLALLRAAAQFAAPSPDRRYRKIHT